MLDNLKNLKSSYEKSGSRIRLQNIIYCILNLAITVSLITITASNSESIGEPNYLDLLIEGLSAFNFFFVFCVIAIIKLKKSIQLSLLIGLTMGQLGLIFDSMDEFIEIDYKHWHTIGDLFFLVGSLVIAGAVSAWVEHSYRASTRDPLTGAYNRRFFMSYLAKYLAQNKRRHIPSALLAFDLDNFKPINDNYGHHVGDQVLKYFSKHLLENYRDADVVCRAGGEEFEVLLVKSSAEEAERSVERLKQKIINNLPTSLPEITASVGIAELAMDDDMESFRKKADEAMYRAKTTGKDKSVIWTEDSFS